MAETLVALIRGINVGPSKRVAMADLRAAVMDLGYGDVRTVLNSGNVVFTAETGPAEAAARIEEVLAGPLGVPARVVVVTAEELATAVAHNPLLDVATEPSRLLVAFLADPSCTVRLQPLLERDWAQEALALGEGVAYLWCPDGVIASRVAQAVGRALKDAVTMRNWTTVMKVSAVIG
jgi:uncharacterized protein (DUF1697 family)